MQGTGGGVGLWTALDGRDNALNFLRLLLAGTVLLAHSWNLATDSPTPGFPQAASFAVDGFFVISGFLIAGSRSRMGLGPYLWRRALRILPGFWVVLVVTAALAAPISAAVQGVWFDWSSAGSYIGSNILLAIHQWDVSGTLATAPVHEWNPPLWTLVYEFGAYLVAAVALTVVRWRRVTSWILLAGCVVWVFAAASGVDINWMIGRLGAFFAAGMVLWFELRRVPASGPLAAVCGGVLVLLFLTWNANAYTAVAPLALGYMLLWLGANLPTRVGARHDVSYGVYIYGAPAQQLMVSTGVAASLGPAWFAAASVAAAVPLAWASWLAVERPAMGLRGLVPVIRQARATPPDPTTGRDRPHRAHASPAAGES